MSNAFEDAEDAFAIVDCLRDPRPPHITPAKAADHEALRQRKLNKNKRPDHEDPLQLKRSASRRIDRMPDQPRPNSPAPSNGSADDLGDGSADGSVVSVFGALGCPARVVFRALGMRLRAMAAFPPAVKRKNEAVIRMIMARRELHRMLIDQLDQLEVRSLHRPAASCCAPCLAWHLARRPPSAVCACGRRSEA